MSEPLFVITEENLETGMRGYPVGYCTTSSVDPVRGLLYMGQSVAELADREPIEVIFLLYNGRNGTKEEVHDFKHEIEKKALCSKDVKEAICKLPRKGHPMKLFTAALLIAGMIEGKGNYREDCLNIIAKIPEITAIVINHHAGWGETKPSEPKLGYMENFTNMLALPCTNREGLCNVLKIFNLLHYDHGGGNLSTFVGKAVASGLEDMYGSLASAMCALAGPRHGKANQDSLNFVESIFEELGESVSEKTVEEIVRQRLEAKQLVFGFGHAVLRVEDPRATVFYSVGENRFPDDPLVKVAQILRKVGPKVLKENPKITDPYPNVDAISGAVLSAAGFHYPEYFTVLFGLSRCVGIAIQILYEREVAREGRGTPIIRPKYYFKSTI